ncbi:MAG: hypothetical protein WBN22_12765 [Verrucomicrobiia bacterium]
MKNGLHTRQKGAQFLCPHFFTSKPKKIAGNRKKSKLRYSVTARQANPNADCSGKADEIAVAAGKPASGCNLKNLTDPGRSDMRGLLTIGPELRF